MDGTDSLRGGLALRPGRCLQFPSRAGGDSSQSWVKHKWSHDLHWPIRLVGCFVGGCHLMLIAALGFTLQSEFGSWRVSMVLGLAPLAYHYVEHTSYHSSSKTCNIKQAYKHINTYIYCYNQTLFLIHYTTPRRTLGLGPPGIGQDLDFLVQAH